jgi:hypothetical protein
VHSIVPLQRQSADESVGSEDILSVLATNTCTVLLSFDGGLLVTANRYVLPDDDDDVVDLGDGINDAVCLTSEMFSMRREIRTIYSLQLQLWESLLQTLWE